MEVQGKNGPGISTGNRIGGSFEIYRVTNHALAREVGPGLVLRIGRMGVNGKHIAEQLKWIGTPVWVCFRMRLTNRVRQHNTKSATNVQGSDDK